MFKCLHLNITKCERLRSRKRGRLQFYTVKCRHLTGRVYNRKQKRPAITASLISNLLPIAIGTLTTISF
jgi:hypothetical protein